MTFPNNPQFEMGDNGEMKHLSEGGVTDVTPKNLFANFTITSADDGKVLMRGSQINTPDSRAHIEKQAGRHKVEWHDE